MIHATSSRQPPPTPSGARTSQCIEFAQWSPNQSGRFHIRYARALALTSNNNEFAATPGPRSWAFPTHREIYRQHALGRTLKIEAMRGFVLYSTSWHSYSNASAWWLTRARSLMITTKLEIIESKQMKTRRLWAWPRRHGGHMH